MAPIHPNVHSASVELLSVHVTKTFPRSDSLERGGLSSRDKVLTDRQGRVTGHSDIPIAVRQLGQQLDDIMSIFGILGAKQFDIAYYPRYRG